MGQPTSQKILTPRRRPNESQHSQAAEAGPSNEQSAADMGPLRSGGKRLSAGGPLSPISSAAAQGRGQAHAQADYLLRLQRLGGNRAVAHTLVKQSTEGSTVSLDAPTLQRQMSRVKSAQTAKGLELHTIRMGEREVVLTPSEYRAREADLARTMIAVIRRGRSLAIIHRDAHKTHMEKTRGWAGAISDFLSDVTPPSVTRWGPTIELFERAEESVNRRAWLQAHTELRLAIKWLDEDIRAWKSYLRASIGGSESIVSTLQTVVEVTIAVEVGLLTAGTAYAAIGGGKLAAATAAVAGIGGLATAGATMPGEFGKAVRGTLTEVKAAGLYNNLRYAVNGLWGMAIGVGKGFQSMFEGLATLFTHPLKFLEDIGKLQESLVKLWQHRELLWTHFSRLPPEEQSFRVGQFFGVIESLLMTAEMGNQIGGALQAEADAAGIAFTWNPQLAAADIAVLTRTGLALKAEALATFGSVMMMTAQTSKLGSDLKKSAEDAEAGGAAKPQGGPPFLQPEGFKVGQVSVPKSPTPQVLGQEIEEPVRQLVAKRYGFKLSSKPPSATGPDIVVPKSHRAMAGFDLADVKPLNEGGVKKFWEQLDNWRDNGWAGGPKSFKGKAALFGYDSQGNVYLYGIFDL